MAVIELGSVSGDDAEPAEPARRPLVRRDLRWMLVALVTAGCVLTVTGSARPGPGGLTQLWSTEFAQGSGSFMLTPDSVYVLTGSGTDRLTAYDLRSGAVRWSHPAPDDTTRLGDLEVGTLLLPAGLSTVTLEEADGSTVAREVNPDTVAVDTATGRQLWRHPGELVTTTGDRALLTEWSQAGDKIAAFRMVRLRDGSTVWSRPAGDIDSWVTDYTWGATAAHLVTVGAKGRAEVLDLTDGAVVATGTLPWLSAAAQGNDHTSLTVTDGQLLLDRNEGGQSKVIAYDVTTLRQLWRLEQGTHGGLFGCGPVVCVNGTSDTVGHDRRTGEVRWRLPGAASGFPLLNGQVLVTDETGSRHRLVHAATGRPIAELGTAEPVWEYQLNGLPYVVSRAREEVDRMLLSQVNDRTGEVLLRGTLPVGDYGCQSTGTVVVCVTRDDRLVVTDAG